MPRGPKGEKRPADVIGAAMVARSATGEIESKKAKLRRYVQKADDCRAQARAATDPGARATFNQAAEGYERLARVVQESFGCLTLNVAAGSGTPSQSGVFHPKSRVWLSPNAHNSL